MGEIYVAFLDKAWNLRWQKNIACKQQAFEEYSYTLKGDLVGYFPLVNKEKVCLFFNDDPGNAKIIAPSEEMEKLDFDDVVISAVTIDLGNASTTKKALTSPESPTRYLYSPRAYFVSPDRLLVYSNTIKPYKLTLSTLSL
jgi:hypothetical protein